MLAQEILDDVHRQLSELENKKKGATNKNMAESEPLVPLLINCASQEYAKSVLPHLNTGRGSDQIRVVECVFLDGGIIKSAFAKRARGAIALEDACLNDACT